MAKDSPTKRTLLLLRKNNYCTQVVERWNMHAKVRQDLFGCIDVVAATGHQVWGIQACAASSQSARRKKILAEPRAKLWVESGARLFVHGWRKKRKERGGKQMIWH